VLDSYRRLAGGADLVLIEGAGSPAEINLRSGDIANMGFARAAGAPVVLVGDIDRGGVIASIVGTWVLLDEPDRRHLKGYIINKFRGDVRLFDGGLRAITERTGLPGFGVAPWFAAASLLPAEDAVALQGRRAAGADPAIRVAVPVFSRIANFDDLDPLIAEPDVSVTFVRPGEAMPGDADLFVLPGSKATLADLAFVRDQGWDVDIRAHVRRGGAVVGLCGGYQMLGTAVRDPLGVEGRAGEVAGLGMLRVETELTGDKTLTEATGTDTTTGAPVRGYEMHVGRTSGPDRDRPMLRLGDGTDGAISADGRIFGCYLHGLFASDAFRQAFLGRLRDRAASGLAYETQVECVLDDLAEHLETHLDLNGLLAASAQVDAVSRAI
jgi:adenosylcobyric acid synthase